MKAVEGPGLAAGAFLLEFNKAPGVKLLPIFWKAPTAGPGSLCELDVANKNRLPAVSIDPVKKVKIYPRNRRAKWLLGV